MGKLSCALKRAADVLVVLLVCPLVLLVTLVIVVVIRLTSPGPVIFRQERAGRNMQPFILYKFRTMRLAVDPYGASPKGADDPRLTGIGRFLRAASLDELPQLWNVLRGDMSLVGPRPLYMAQAAEWSARQRRRLEVKPGLTGLAQTEGRGSLTIEEKLELDVRYVERQSLALDARILVRTCIQLFIPKNIYEKRYSSKEITRGENQSS